MRKAPTGTSWHSCSMAFTVQANRSSYVQLLGCTFTASSSSESSQFLAGGWVSASGTAWSTVCGLPVKGRLLQLLALGRLYGSRAGSSAKMNLSVLGQEEGPVVELLVGEGVLPLEVDGHCDVVWRARCGDLAPIEQLVRVGKLRQPDEAKLELETAWERRYRSGVSRTTPIYYRVWPSSFSEQMFIFETYNPNPPNCPHHTPAHPFHTHYQQHNLSSVCLNCDSYMSDEEEEVSNQEEEEEEENEEDEDEEGEEEDDDEQEQEDGDEDQDQDGDGSDEDEQEEEQQGSDDGSKQQSEQPADKLPKFRSIEPEEFKFTSLLSEIASLSNSVDHFINTLPSHGGSSHYRSYIPPPPRLPEVPLVLPKEQPPRVVVVMKDEDTQVSMQPQIVIQPTRVEKPVEPSYKISNESSKFLAQLYEQNKKLKRWQNSSHSVNNHSATSAFYGSRERFERQEYEKGLFNVDERNREIDQAIQMLKRESDS